MDPLVLIWAPKMEAQHSLPFSFLEHPGNAGFISDLFIAAAKGISFRPNLCEGTFHLIGGVERLLPLRQLKQAEE